MLTPEQRLLKLMELKRLKRDFSLFTYAPYQKQKDFHWAGGSIRQRCLMAGNQLGKTYAAGCETAMHLTGLYPDWWGEGKRFKRATRGWAGSKNAEVARDGAQRILLGPTNSIGSGTIPKDRILEIKKARGVPDAVESVLVKHNSGDTSLLVFKGYLDGREAWQAETLDFVWFDEEPPQDIYSEGLTRTNNTKGIAYLTFTPLMGMTSVVKRFYQDKEPGTFLIMMTIDDVGHLDAADKAQIVAAYLPHEREARANGIPMFGKGRVFTTEESFLEEEPLMVIPPHFKQIIGLDFGWDHPTAATRLAYDPTNDIVHIVSAYRQRQQTPIIHASAIKKWGDWIPVAWPKDGLQTDKGSGIQLAQTFRAEGLNMITEHAQFPDKRGIGVEAGLMEMQQRMDTGGLKIDRNLLNWFEEYRMYHRMLDKDGLSKIYDKDEDLICSTRYAMMMLRYAISEDEHGAVQDRWKKSGRRNSGRSWMSA
jgi:phage terminase large subunit-like protein